MKPLALAMILVSLAAAAVAAQSVVDTAKAAKANRKKSTAKVLTNSDVKKSKGKIGQTPALAPVDAAPEESLVDKQKSMRKARADYNQNSAAARATVAQLEKEVAALEQQYYEENDLDRRDREIVRRFDTAKKKLDAAREALAKLQPVP